MLLVACALSIVAAASTLPSDAPPQVRRPQYPSEEALRRYAQGRLFEEAGLRDLAVAEYSRALLLDEGAASVARRLSETSANGGDPGRSLEFAEQVLKAAPGDARALWLKGAALLNLERPREALEPLAAAARADSERVEYLRTLGRAAMTLDRMDIAIPSYSRVTWLEPEDAESWFQLGAAQARDGRFGAADSSLSEVMELNPMRPGVYFLRGWVQENLGKVGEAIQLYDEHLQRHPQDGATRRREVSLLAGQKRFGDALRAARLLAEAEPQDRGIAELEADMAFLAGKPDDATRALERLRRRSPDDAGVLALSVRVLARHDRAGKAVTEAEAWSARRPRDMNGYLIAATARLMNEQPDLALAHLNRAIEVAPDSLAPRVALARFQQDRGQTVESVKTWNETARRFPVHNGVAFDLAAARERAGDLPGAEAAVRDVLRREPENAAALNFLGYLWADHNLRLDEAVALIQRALAQDPENGAYVDSLGWAYYRLGRLAEARVQLERAVRLSRGDPVVLEHLGDLYKDMALKDLAIDQYQRILAANPDNPRVQAKLDALR